MTKRIFLALLATLFVANVSAEPVEYPTNKDGSTITGVIYPLYDPASGDPTKVPIPTNLFFSDTTDLTLNIPGVDPGDVSNPFFALNALDGFSTTEKWVVNFAGEPHGLDFGSVVAGQSVRMFEVSTVFGTIVQVSGIVRELEAGVEYTALSDGNTLVIFPLKPLKEMTTYMAVLTNDINDSQGNDATPDTTYHLSKRADPWIDENGNSTYDLVDDATAQGLEGLRQITAAQEAAAESAGIPKEDIVLSFTAQTQAITPVLKHLRSIAKPAPTQIAPAGVDTSAVGGKGLADIYIGVITLPYYLGIPSAENPTAPLFDFWQAAPGGYIPPFDGLGLDPTSTFVTVANPFPVETGKQTVPLLMTVPNEASGHVKPAAGWPVVIFGHGLGRQRSDMLRIADTAAAAGFAVMAADGPMHGIRPEDEDLALLYVENTPWADVANERTFDVDYSNNETGALEPDGITDVSGRWFINLISLLTQRDNYRQTQADFSVMAVTVPSISIDGDALPDLDGSNIQYVSISGGSVLGQPFIATEPMVNNAFMSVGGGGIARLLDGSATLGPGLIHPQLEAAGLERGSTDYELYLLAWQTVVDSADPINWAQETVLFNNVVVHEVIGDLVVPNSVPLAPLSGTEPMIAVMGLKSYSSTQTDPKGVDLAGRFPPPASHGSLIDPSTSPAATVEMQKQMASFLLSKGTAVVVEDAATMVPVSAEGKVELNQPEKAPPAANKLKLKIKK